MRKNALQYVRNALGERRKIFPAPAQETDEWAVIDVAFPRFEEARLRLLALGGAVEVIHPQALRASMADFAEQIMAPYNRPPKAPVEG